LTDFTYIFYCFVFVSHVEVRFDISLIKELIDWLTCKNCRCCR